MSDEPSQKPTGHYGGHSKKFWFGIYLVAAIIVYGLIYVLFIHKSGGSSGSFGY